MPKTLVFIDESGDAGLTGSTSSCFIMAAVVVMSEDDALAICKKIHEFKKINGLSEQYEIKFSKTRKDIIKALLRHLSSCDYQVYGIVIDKEKSNYKTFDRYSLYNHVLVELLKTLPFASVKVTLDGEAGKKYQKSTTAFLRRQLVGKMQIDGFKYANSSSLDELQLADVVAGSINRSFSNLKDARDYLDILNDKIVEIKQL